MSRMFALAAVLASVLVFLPSATRADVPPLGLSECEGRAAGVACTVGSQSGACEATTCSRLDYSNGTPPRSVDYPCVICQPGATPTASGCSAAQGGHGLGAGLSLALAGLALARRRR